MISKNTLLGSAILLLCLSSYSSAGTADWDGKYTININNQNVDVVHTPKQVRFMFLSVGKCLSLSKGANINGIEIPADVKLCTTDNIPTFSAEVQKLGVIKSKDINPSPDYND